MADDGGSHFPRLKGPLYRVVAGHRRRQEYRVYRAGDCRQEQSHRQQAKIAPKGCDGDVLAGPEPRGKYRLAVRRKLQPKSGDGPTIGAIFKKQ